MTELQAADEAKAKAEAAQAAKKAAESASGSDTGAKKPAKSEVKSNEKPLDAETQRLLDIAPRIVDVIIDMWNASALRQGWPVVVKAVETRHSVRLGALSREVCQTFKSSIGSEEDLQVLIKRYSPHRTAGPGAGQGAGQPAIITPTDPKSSTNQAQQQNIAPNPAPSPAPNTASGGAGSAPGSAPKGAPDPILEMFERNRKLRPLK